MHARAALAFASGLVFGVPAAGASPTRRPSLEVLPVEHLPAYVVGFPLHVAISVRARADTSFNMLHFGDFLRVDDSIGAEITPLHAGKSAGETIRFVPSPEDADLRMETRGSPGEPLAAGATHRMLVDVSPWFTPLGAGDYAVRFSFATAGGDIERAPAVTLHVRAPTPTEADELAAAGRNADEPWAAWTLRCVTPWQPSPIAATDPLRFDRAVRTLLCQPQPVAKADPAILDVLTGLYAPERLALQAELARARGDDAAFAHLIAQLRASTPGLSWWLAELAASPGALYLSLRTR